MRISQWSSISKVVAIAATVVIASNASAQVVAIGSGAFAGSPPPVTFTSAPFGAEVNGLSHGGFQFLYSLGAGHVFVSGGPGATNHVTDPSVVSTGNNTGVLTIIMPTLSNGFGFGFALLTGAALPFGVSVTALNGATSLGTLLYGSAPDPLFTGGFAGIQSVSAFDRVQLSFNSIDAPAFSVDNLIYNTSVVPEPSSFLLTAAGVGALFFSYRRRNRKALQR